MNKGYPKIIMDILNYLRISINELWISKNEHKISISESGYLNVFMDIQKKC